MRIAFIFVVVAIGLLSASASAFGASALSHTTNASAAQYGVAQRSGAVLGSGERVTPVAATKQKAGSGPTAIAASGPTAIAASTQPKRQLKSVGGDLPFTGYLAIPMLLLGVTALLGGLMLRRGRPRTDALPG